MLFQTQSCGISLLKLWSWTCVHPPSTHLPLILSILKVYHWFIESLQVVQWLISCRRWLPLEIMLTMQEVLCCTLNSRDYSKLIIIFIIVIVPWFKKIIWVIGALRTTDVSTICAEAIFRGSSEDDSEEDFPTGCRNVSHKQLQFFAGLQSPWWSFSILGSNHFLIIIFIIIICIIIGQWLPCFCHMIQFFGQILRQKKRKEFIFVNTE